MALRLHGQPVEDIDTAVIGGSQAGLAVSCHLKEAGRPHLVIERDRIGARWLGARWDSLTLVTPNWMNRLPGFSFREDDPDGFLARDDIVRMLEAYALSFDPPLICGVEVRRLAPDGEGYLVQTDAGDLRARHVVVCTGYFHAPSRPLCAAAIDRSIAQLHSSEYRNPDRLPPGGVLVVGSGQSGAQIAEELHEAGRPTVLAVSGAVREPRRYRGRDTNYWWNLMGGFDRPIADPGNPKERYTPNPHCSGKAGGHALNLEKFAHDGIRLVGRVESAEGARLGLAADMIAKVRHADAECRAYMRAIDRFIAEQGISAPEPAPENTDDGTPTSPPALAETTALDLAADRIRSIVWATGYRCDFGWIDLPILDERGYPRQTRGISPYPGLYFCGLHWMHTLGSGLLFGVGEAARHVVTHLDRAADALDSHATRAR